MSTYSKEFKEEALRLSDVNRSRRGYIQECTIR